MRSRTRNWTHRRWLARLGATVLATTALASASATIGGVAKAPSADAACSAADPQATPAACSLLNFMKRPTTESKHRILSGQQVEPFWVGTHTQNVAAGWKHHITDLKTKTNQTPLIAGFDFVQYVRAEENSCIKKHFQYSAADMAKINAEQLTAMVAKLKQHVGAGGIATVSWHANNPWNRCAHDNLVVGNFADVYTAGTVANANFNFELDHVARGLQQLEDANVPVLFRPLHEMNGDWFWWGNRPTGEFTKLWNYVHSYLTTTKGLHNLLWVYSAASSQYFKAADAYYTRDHIYCAGPFRYENGRYVCDNPRKILGTASRVDVLGLDVYDDGMNVVGYDHLAKYGKPLGLTEYGPSSKDGNANFDQMTVKRVVVDYPKISFAVAWATVEGRPMALVDTKNAGAYLLDGAVATLESGLKPYQ